MRNSSARLGTLQFSEQDSKTIARLRELADAEPVADGAPPSKNHHDIVCGIEIAWLMVIDQEDGIGQYRLLIKGTDGEPDLGLVQAMAVVFFGNQPYEIMPEPKSLSTVRVSGLFFPL
jgi:hypothetical protein